MDLDAAWLAGASTLCWTGSTAIGSSTDWTRTGSSTASTPTGCPRPASTADRLLARVDANALIDRVDVNQIVAKVNVDALIAKTELGAIVAKSTSGVADRGPRRRPQPGRRRSTPLMVRWANRVLRRPATGIPAGPGRAGPGDGTGHRGRRAGVGGARIGDVSLQGHFAGGGHEVRRATPIDATALARRSSAPASPSSAYAVGLVTGHDFRLSSYPVASRSPSRRCGTSSGSGTHGRSAVERLGMAVVGIRVVQYGWLGPAPEAARSSAR